jgi:hypothetical protein
VCRNTLTRGAAGMANLSPEDYARMMIGGGRRIDGNRSKRG